MFSNSLESLFNVFITKINLIMQNICITDYVKTYVQKTKTILFKTQRFKTSMLHYYSGAIPILAKIFSTEIPKKTLCRGYKSDFTNKISYHRKVLEPLNSENV